MTSTSVSTQQGSKQPRSRVEIFVEGLVADIAITAAIVWGLVLLGEPLMHVLTSPIFVILSLGSLGHLVHKSMHSKTMNPKTMNPKSMHPMKPDAQ